MMQDALPRIVEVLASSSALLLAIAGVIVALLTYLRRGRLKFGQLEVEFRGGDIKREVEQAATGLPPAADKPVTPIDRQYVLLREYHAQGLAQSRVSFWFSLVFASLGFLVIVTTLLTMDRARAVTDQGATLVGLVAGTIIDAVSALFFVQSNKARHLMTEFFDRLRTDRKFEESLQIADSIRDPAAQSRLKVLLAVNFAGVTANDGVIRELFGSSSNVVKDPGTPAMTSNHGMQPTPQTGAADAER